MEYDEIETEIYQDDCVRKQDRVWQGEKKTTAYCNFSVYVNKKSF